MSVSLDLAIKQLTTPGPAAMERARAIIEARAIKAGHGQVAIRRQEKQLARYKAKYNQYCQEIKKALLEGTAAKAMEIVLNEE
jgi:hypothetical protein